MSRKILTLVLLPLILGACSDARETLGLGRVTPDEFAVVDRPPLVIPPDFALRPPQPGAPRPQAVAPVKQAEQAAFGTAASAAPAATNDPLANAVLAQAGSAVPDIRAKIDSEAVQHVSGSRHLVDELLWWRKDSAGDAAVVDAAAEAERVRANQAVGKPVNAGPTPTIEKRSSGWLGL